ncbi:MULTISPECIES: phosphoenolpyruvate carboxykinase (GTP) [Anaerotruncus]|jgi:phosphoenolpyruvate carboxykinase (GTP)|uniref:Phosphoenolpyruvate carboxykinase [GTP] n=1 Tax=Anaerotruncus colihominis TaxID=169435 RepID=A0A845T1B2_9FIRM|nr:MULTISPECIES: phosphoenolpyruvate carboxykinase (GTP) [Anaerotruncus]MCI8493742.1 phosphoenolpyruvate carboxykinase (GTP) [Anaerotruncus sp.]MCR2025156.1 phosphoenolpyruvate carboxykinase (GTP) [Anaerotruncus colihominis]NBI78903.1 phosphoenolpyruvate carboxykinase (GTP) [Anaerotruncus colihominis]NDO40543.1 phosphoenolpyruvate carboxykinase (GTP) [Anaerotruncus colihominis]
MTNNKNVLNWIEEMKALVEPDKVVWIDGSEAQLKELRDQALATGEMEALNPEKLPGCLLHRTAVNDVARVEGRTFICSRKKEDAGPTNNWEDPNVMYDKLRKLFDGAMKGRTMYVIPYCMGPIGSPFSKVGVELTDSIYVVLNMDIMTRMGQQAFDQLGETSNDFVRGLHSKAQMDEENRYIVQFPEDNTIWSVNSGYGGNVLLGKKCFALRIASYQAKNEGWMAEHMLILGLENPQGEIKYVCAAFPSACGKTNLAMLIPPEKFKKAGYKVWTVGDDIAWLRIGPDGRLWAINPENGFFGVAPGTNMKSNPNALISTQKNTIFTNVVHNLDDNTVWWEGLDKNPPKNALNWKGEKWDCTDGSKGAHPNSRFTAPAINCPCISSEFNNPNGVPISAIIFGGRRAKTAPLVYQARDWQHGVFVGSTMASETTAAAAGAVGVVRRDPMAMLPFCGYNMGDYWAHWLEMGKKLGDKAPKIFNVNWFRTDDEGHFIWPGFGDNMRVLNWIVDRCEGKADAVETPIGYEPKPEDIDVEGLDITTDTVRDLLSVDKSLWKEEVKGIKEFYAKFGDKLPKALESELATLESNLNK